MHECGICWPGLTMFKDTPRLHNKFPPIDAPHLGGACPRILGGSRASDMQRLSSSVAEIVRRSCGQIRGCFFALVRSANELSEVCASVSHERIRGMRGGCRVNGGVSFVCHMRYQLMIANIKPITVLCICSVRPWKPILGQSIDRDLLLTSGMLVLDVI
jgi:hypothetical protein